MGDAKFFLAISVCFIQFVFLENLSVLGLALSGVEGLRNCKVLTGLRGTNTGTPPATSI